MHIYCLTAPCGQIVHAPVENAVAQLVLTAVLALALRACYGRRIRPRLVNALPDSFIWALPVLELMICMLIVSLVALDASGSGLRRAGAIAREKREAAVIRKQRVKLDMDYEIQGFCTRGLVLPESLEAYANLMARATRTGTIRVGIVGGSTSEGGGAQTGCQVDARRARLCGLAYHSWLRKWFAAKNIRMQLLNGGKGATGADFAYICLNALWPGVADVKQVNASANASAPIDLVIIEFAINEGGGCAQVDGRMETLLTRLRATAPSAQMLFLNTFTCHTFCAGRAHLDGMNADGADASAEHCLHAVARRHGLASLSWRRAIRPFLSTRSAAPDPVLVNKTVALMEPPLWHHPNVEGHRHLAGLVACLLSRAGQISKSNHSMASHRQLSTREAPTLPDLPLSDFPDCRLIGMDPLRPSANGTFGQGWHMAKRGLIFAASAPNATLVVPFECPSARGCGLSVMLTQSYQPLGLLDLYVDERLAHARVSAANPTWARKRDPTWTISTFIQAARGLQKGRHTLKVVARGETLREIEMLHLPTNYEAHEVHVRGFVVLPAPSQPKKEPRAFTKRMAAASVLGDDRFNFKHNQTFAKRRATKP